MSTATRNGASTVERPVEEKFNDHLGLQDVDYVELYVNNAKQAAHFYQSVFGFELVAFSGLETGNRDRASYYLEQGNTTGAVEQTPIRVRISAIGATRGSGTTAIQNVTDGGESNNVYAGDLFSDGSNGSPRTGTETRAINHTVRIWERTA